MNLDRALQLNTAALAVMGALFLGLGHESLVLPLALGAAAVVSVTLASRLGWLRLNRIIANLVALGAVIWALRNFMQIGSKDQLLAIADMLVYLQVVLLFQEKTGRIYWQLIVLSLLQVVVAAALNLGPQSGLLLAAYMLLALSALVLLCLFHEWRKLVTPAALPSKPAGPAWQPLLAPPQLCLAPSVIQQGIGARPAAIARQVGLLAGATVLMAGVFFYATPRLGEGAWSSTRSGTHAVTGVVLDASLEEFGRIHQSNQLVMRVSLGTALGGRQYPLVSEPYFHGMALAHYVYGENGSRWIMAQTPRISSRFRGPTRSNSPPPAYGLVRQDIMLEGSSPQLFAILPVHHLPDGVHFRELQYRLVRSTAGEDATPRRDFRYSTSTSGLRSGRQLRGIPYHLQFATEGDGSLMKEEYARFLDFDRRRFPALAAAATQALRDDNLEEAGPLERALALERHFLSGERYKYSLTLDFTRDRSLDPIEDFVANHRTGHCEYFAGALALMLRSQGIPSRIIVGFHGGDFNSVGDYYQVRQKHAHAWVEALIPPGEAPEWEIAGPPGSGGTWYRLDPTPLRPATAVGATEPEGVFDRLVQTFDYAELLWRDYVLSLNASKQRSDIYEPVTRRALGGLPGWLDFRNIQRMLRRWAARLGWDVRRNPTRENALTSVFDWRTGSLVVAALTIGLMLLHATTMLVRLVRRWRKTAAIRARRAQSAPPRFYRRLVSLLARLHLQRADSQTARELAARAAGILDRAGAREAIAGLPREIVDSYYRVRFGGAALDSDDLAAIEHALAQLTPAVNQARQ
jgi:transglutaminase-like putative cysteine protease